ncbi:MAG TPA: YihY/virulence factor BrkB family protein [Candidatus Limnocylindrales bacterium]
MRERLDQLIARLRENFIVRRVLGVMEASNAVGAPLLATALAYTTMFAILPGVLLLSGVLGWIIEDPIRRAELLARLVSYLPPLAPIFEGSLEGLVTGRGALSIIGVIGLLWGASSFYAALDEVMRRLFPGGPARSFLSVRLRGALAVLVLVLLVVGTIALGGIWTVVQNTVGELRDLLAWLLPVLSIALVTLVVLATYLWVPTAPPSPRAALPPAIVAGIGIGLLTNVFTALAPLLVGSLSTFGVLATVFAAFIWLNLCFQLLVWGAAWARYRRDRFQQPVAS